MAKHHEDHPEYGELGIFAGYGEMETAMTERTPGPWRINPGRNLRIVAGGDDTVATVGCDSGLRNQWEANAAAIVKWENHFDELVEALSTLLDCGSAIIGASIDDEEASEAFDMYKTARKQARAILAKVKP